MLRFATVVKYLTLMLSLACALAVSPAARAQSVINASNTIVRLAISTGGTNFGHVDVELFDQDKPQTVQNFLLYVYGGGYSNVALQRLVPNFVLQGGNVTITNPASTNRFTSYVPGPNFGPITNEYSVGPELSNLAWTIAMARSPGQTNSADAQFFFNLNNNTNLDTVDGGFTVFGHVVNTTAPDNGTNLLAYFNGLQFPTQVRGWSVSNPFDSFATLPVSGPRYYYLTNNQGTVTTNVDFNVRNSDLFVINPSILTNARPQEANAPSLTLSDTSDLDTTNRTLEVSGTAGDDTGVNRILFETPYSRLTVLPATNWTRLLELVPGTNDFTVWSVDVFGNRSAPQKRKVFCRVPSPIHLSVQGPGSIVGLTNGQVLLAGVNYQLTARPRPGKYFLDWRGDLFSQNRSILFRMTEDMSLLARFADTLLGQARGTYNGLFFSNTNGPKESMGWLTLNFTSTGQYYGRLAPLGANYQTRGQFDASGISIINGQLGADTLTLVLDLIPETDAILANYSNGHFLSDGALFRSLTFKGGTNTPKSMGRYTFLLYPTADTNVLSGDGYGSGTMTVSSRGRITMSGRLGDGATIKQSTYVAVGERWPFYSTAYLGRGGVLGFGLFNSNNLINTSVRWFSPDFPGRTNQVVRLAVSPYTPASSARLFNWTNGVVTLSGGGLANPLSASLLLNEDGSFTIPSNPNNIQLTVTDATGLLAGSFTHPGTLALTALKGAVLQSSNIAAGYFGSGTNNGSVVIKAQ